MNEPDLTIDIEPVWRARVEVRQGGVTLRRYIEGPAKTQEQARERMEAALAIVWTDYEFLTQPTLKERQ